MNFPPVRQHGFSMIEVLIAVLILSFGISSIGMMMLATMTNTRGAMYRSRAISLAQDMVERIHANYEGRALYDTDDTAGADKGCFQSGGAAPSACSMGDLAAHDIWQWKDSLDNAATGLPSGTGSIDRDPTTLPPEYTITINWSEGRDGDQAFTLRTRL